ncbi:MAG: hypothetical protein CGU28_04070 [Candidatus Dactylopiibacterium carminicum]|uniref:Methyltransferase n=1 Tax=Candidatus Dactylopiibacterium carminicum TaxID=857335 RepID=A0A272EXF3_9RHOO|nr:hypothetical protein [Candidatus Dactylopiibacterium carminicum]KAF7600183.1 hypothetical protein BGI27_03775 [Candidatus Dactylopiibacterium carminicum]PAS94798.1 MAG: hypothetical protein CGU29_02530 [Candidatus Dactylopiibacterium carminicum]PAS97722.1 MAG: hypothetical protein CGU28_04070 [Candidatus Dactylopiibacterium carminicum]PAT00184.1 MAG: hypothetical protein BSR46_03800 [Candidatus Dactylopiibacterium carminicum]
MRALRTQWLDAGGGLGYHLRAWRHGAQWQPYRAALAGWLQAWQPPQRQLVIIGPSAGHTLPGDFLEGFSRVFILEPDPLARWLLLRRFPRVRFEAGALDCFADAQAPGWLACTYPDAVFLFANVIGQYLPADPGWVPALRQALAERSWASCHDLVASTRTPDNTSPRDVSEGQTLEALLTGFWPAGELDLHDHGSWQTLPTQAATIWSITPRQHHLVGWYAQRAG